MEAIKLHSEIHTYDGPREVSWVPIDSIIANPNNNIFRETAVDEEVIQSREDLKFLIETEGLHRAPTVWEGDSEGNFLDAGWNRIMACLALGWTMVPVQRKPRTKRMIEDMGADGAIDFDHPDVCASMRVDNKSTTHHPIASVMAAEADVKSFVTYYGKQPTPGELKSIITRAGSSVPTYKKALVLRDGGEFKKVEYPGDPRLFQELLTGKEKRIETQFKKMQTNLKIEAEFDRDETLEKIFANIPFESLTKDVVKALKKEQDEQPHWYHLDKNTQGGYMHGVLTTNFIKYFNESQDVYEARPGKAMKGMDILFFKDDKQVNALETKTTMVDGFTTTSEKYGYSLGFVWTEEQTEGTIVICYLDRNSKTFDGKPLWRKAGSPGMSVLPITALVEYVMREDTYSIVPMGRMSLQNKKYKTVHEVF